MLYVANHNGGIAGPDLACTLGTLWEARGPEAPLYALAHDFVMRQFQQVGAVIQRFGALRAKPENALSALRAGAQVLVYPGGDLDAYRHTRRRDEVVLGTRTGFVRVAQAAGVPIVPIVAHGAHRSAYIFTEGEAIARRLALKRWARLERFPIALALPWGVALGPWLPYLPLPFPVRLRALPPIEAPADVDPVSRASWRLLAPFRDRAPRSSSMRSRGLSTTLVLTSGASRRRRSSSRVKTTRCSAPSLRASSPRRSLDRGSRSSPTPAMI